MSKVIKNSIIKKLEKMKASKTTINAFTKQIDTIISQKYRLMERLNLIKNNISVENNNWTKLNSFLSTTKREVKTEKKEAKKNNINNHLVNIPTSFNLKSNENNKKAFNKILTLIKGKITVSQLKVNYKKKGIVKYIHFIEVSTVITQLTTNN